MKLQISLAYPRSLYADDLFARAVADYAHICKVKVYTDRQSVVCTFYESVTDLELTAKEFSNYLIELAVSRSDA